MCNIISVINTPFSAPLGHWSTKPQRWSCGRFLAWKRLPSTTPRRAKRWGCRLHGSTRSCNHQVVRGFFFDWFSIFFLWGICWLMIVCSVIIRIFFRPFWFCRMIWDMTLSQSCLEVKPGVLVGIRQSIQLYEQLSCFPLIFSLFHINLDTGKCWKTRSQFYFDIAVSFGWHHFTKYKHIKLTASRRIAGLCSMARCGTTGHVQPGDPTMFNRIVIPSDGDVSGLRAPVTPGCYIINNIYYIILYCIILYYITLHYIYIYIYYDVF